MADKVITEALARFKRVADDKSETAQRQREIEDGNFEFDPWPADVKAARGGYTLAGEKVPARPMVNIPMLDQPVQLVINQEKAAHLGIEVHPETDDADDETAEIQQGIIRQIERKSRAGLARSWAFERAVKCGRGYYRILKQYCNPSASGPARYDQELVIKRILNQACVYFDPDATEPDNSDAAWAFITQDLSKEAYLRKYGKSKLAKLSTEEFQGLGDDSRGWMTEKTYRIAEYFTVETSTSTQYAYDNDGEFAEGSADELDDETKARATTAVEIEQRKIIWRIINGVEVLKEVEWDGQYIPIVTVIGREYNLNGIRRWNGIIGQAKDAARLVNYAASTVIEKVAIDVKSPWVLAEGQEEGHEAEFARASVRPVPYVRYKPKTVGAELAPPPVRNLAGPDISADIELLQQAKDFVHTATFTFDPSLGNVKQSDRMNKGAILALQEQGDQGNSHYLDNLAEASMTYEANVLLDAMPPIYDRPGRIARIIDSKEEKQKVMLNQPFRMDGEKPVPVSVAEGDPLPQGVKYYNLRRGAYSSSVGIGKSYKTRMQQGSDALGQLLQADPALMPIIGWRYFKYNDNIPGHNEIADDLKKLRPPQLQDPNDPQNAQLENQQLKGQLAQAQQIMQQMAMELATDKIKAEAQLQAAAHKDAAGLLKAHLDNETKIAVAELGAKTERDGLFYEERARVGLQAHELATSAADAGHEERMASIAHQQALEQSQAAHDQAVVQAEQGQQHALEQGQQAADLAPEPAASA